MVTVVMFALVFDFPFLANCIIWFLCNQILAGLNLIVYYVHGVTSKLIFESFGTNIVLKSLVVEASPFICNNVIVEALKKWCAWHSNTVEAAVFGVPDPLLVWIRILSTFPDLKLDVVNTGLSWCVEICRVDRQCHLFTVFVKIGREEVHWISCWKCLKVVVSMEIMWACTALLNFNLIFGINLLFQISLIHSPFAVPMTFNLTSQIKVVWANYGCFFTLFHFLDGYF